MRDDSQSVFEVAERDGDTLTYTEIVFDRPTVAIHSSKYVVFEYPKDEYGKLDAATIHD